MQRNFKEEGPAGYPAGRFMKKVYVNKVGEP
ncbi:hypothetical protein HNQ54_003067 [Anaerocolumna cellulosilytica]|nr:hypothetical protein [Anaerocolumna cellulosilytica]